jgi:uncharacterized protein
MEVSSSLSADFLATEFVLVELANALSSQPYRERCVALIRYLKGEPQQVIVPASAELVQRGLELYSRRRDKEWSLTDCISFLVMDDYGSTQALSTDHHFAQAGYEPLLLD